MFKEKEYPTENVEYLKKNGVLSYALLTPVHPDSICWLWIEVVTPLDGHSSSSIRLAIDFIDQSRDCTIYAPCEISVNMGIHELKALRAFPVLLNMLTDIEGTMITVKDMCRKLEENGIKNSSAISVDDYLVEHKELRNREDSIFIKRDSDFIDGLNTSGKIIPY